MSRYLLIELMILTLKANGEDCVQYSLPLRGHICNQGCTHIKSKGLVMNLGSMLYWEGDGREKMETEYITMALEVMYLGNN